MSVTDGLQVGNEHFIKTKVSDTEFLVTRYLTLQAIICLAIMLKSLNDLTMTKMKTINAGRDNSECPDAIII